MQVLVASIGSGMQAKRMELASWLWEAGIAVRCCDSCQGVGTWSWPSTKWLGMDPCR